MDAYQQHHRYMRPPSPAPPSTVDPHHYHHQQHQPRPPLPPQSTWYPNQFQYHPPLPSTSHSPSPPPPQQWPAPPHSDHLAPPPPPYAYPPPPPPHQYPAHLPPKNHHFPAAAPLPHMPPPPNSQIPQSYSQVNQEWGNSNWGQHQGWDYQGHNNAEDWAAKARAWAAAKKVAMEDQSSQPQFPPSGKPEEQSGFHDQYPQPVDSHYQDVQTQPFPAPGYQQFAVSAAPSNQPTVFYPQESVSFNSGQSYVRDGHLPYAVGGGTSAGAPTTSPSVYPQEVPSSYSSVTGKEEAADQKELQYKSLPLLGSSAQGQHHVQSSLQPYAHGNQTASTTDLSDQPLDFAPSFNRDHDLHIQSSYAAPHDPVGTIRGIGTVNPVPSITSWNPSVATSAAYSPIPPVLPLVPQHDPSMAMPPPVPGPAVQPFGSFPGTSFQPNMSSSGAPYGLGAGTHHSTTSFHSDAYGVSNVSDRPKKASVPNWLKEEIIKNASVITRSSLEHPKEETKSTEDEDVDNSVGKGDQADSKSINSSRSTEEEDDDDDEDSARTEAINQEIKRILTEVLLKVTDELFDEIATKVLAEDDLTVEVEHNGNTSNHNVLPPSPAILIPKASAKVLVPDKANGSETEDASEKSNSILPGNILGLANYASDEDDDDEIQTSSIPDSRKKAVFQLSSTPNFSKDVHDIMENGYSQVELDNNSREQTNLESNLAKSSSIESQNKTKDAVNGLIEHNKSSTPLSGSKDGEISADGGNIQDSNNGAGSKSTPGKNVMTKPELLGESASKKKSVVDSSQPRETRIKSDKDNQYDDERNYSGKDIVKEAGRGSRGDENGGDLHRRQEEKNLRKEKTDDWNGSKERKKERVDEIEKKVKGTEPRKRSSHLDVKEDGKEVDKLCKTSAKEDSNRKREQAKDMEEEKVRRKPTNDSSRHKRRRSSSNSSRGRNSRDNDSSEEASDASRRKLHSRTRQLSPSPIRSRRHASRSPHSKHSQRRHSPYSSLESTRGRRSRSKSPVRRHR